MIGLISSTARPDLIHVFYWYCMHGKYYWIAKVDYWEHCWNFWTIYVAVVPARQATGYMLAESIPWNRFLDTIKVLKYWTWCTGWQISVQARSSQISAGIFKQSIGARNRVGTGLSYRPASLHRLAESIPWNPFLGSIKVEKYRLWCTGWQNSVQARSSRTSGGSFRRALYSANPAQLYE